MGSVSASYDNALAGGDRALVDDADRITVRIDLPETRGDVERMFKKAWAAYETLLKDRKDQEAEIDAYRDLIHKITFSDALIETDRDYLCVAYEAKRAKL